MTFLPKSLPVHSWRLRRAVAVDGGSLWRSVAVGASQGVGVGQGVGDSAIADEAAAAATPALRVGASSTAHLDHALEVHIHRVRKLESLQKIIVE